ncbi:1-acyl-sn-glycerol-3-phosphate acyltransferase [Rhodopseudomonas sp. BR0C11]|uniref:lysophospholipid acyltransferase family protein n=1 Tax=Rhodopseudomonas sp. BR0C11 TaxID=2269370 RepID=UPI0013DE872B|nr:lysophospholipid acyltransferase family protein [Rhodopseudomonas sp. BR0C11]NEV75942.1 1-acyl-sn-glycerol-3-phosphate acyltransferase [Rhodopseudomonas sp. BR0C11]
MLRFILVIAAVVPLTLSLLPVHLLAIRFGWRAQRTIPQLYHRIVCALIGVRIHQVGRRCDGPVLILSNHVSWLDICVISAVAPVSFIAKSEVAGWPVFGALARWQRTVFIDRQARHRTGEATREIGARLQDGDAMVLFAEGTSSDGSRVLPFRSALVGAVHHAIGEQSGARVAVQPMAVTYTGFGGLPIGRELRQRVAWYGDAELIPHFVELLSAGAIDVTVSWGDAVATSIDADRKQITRNAEQSVRRMCEAARRAGMRGAIAPRPAAAPVTTPDVQPEAA